MDAHHRLPSAYSEPGSAQATHGARAGKYVDFLQCTDPLADAFMQEFSIIPEHEWRALLDQALATGIESIPAAPEALRTLFRQLEHVPFWSIVNAAILGVLRSCGAGSASPFWRCSPCFSFTVGLREIRRWLSPGN